MMILQATLEPRLPRFGRGFLWVSGNMALRSPSSQPLTLLAGAMAGAYGCLSYHDTIIYHIYQRGHTPCDHIISTVAMTFYRSVQVNMQTVSRFSWSCPSCSLDRSGWFEFCNLPSGYFSRSYREITTFNGKIHYQWPFSIAMLNYQRVLSTDFYQWLSLSLQHPCHIRRHIRRLSLGSKPSRYHQPETNETTQKTTTTPFFTRN